MTDKAPPKMGLLARIAPGLAAARAEARLRLASANARTALLQGFQAAKVGGRQSAWRRPLSSATTELQSALPWLRATSRDLIRNNPHASRAARVLQTHIAGTGVRPRAYVRDLPQDARKAVREETRVAWDRFVENCDPSGQLDFYGQQRLAVRAIVEGGEGLRIWRAVRRNGRLEWQCELVEGDLLDHQKNEPTKNGGVIIQGVEFDARGRRVAYWMHDTHPGDYYAVSRMRQHLKRVPARLVDHMYEVLRPGQVRGVSWFAPSAVIMRDVDDLAEAEVVRKKLEACISMVVYNSQTKDDDTALKNAARMSIGGGQEEAEPHAISNAAGDPVVEMSPGTIVEARPGWSVEFNAPPSSDGLVEHMQERLHAIAAGIGVTYTQMTGDLSSANYSSMRGGELEFNRLVDVWQGDLMIHQSGRRAWGRVLWADQVSRGRDDQIPRPTWTPPKRPWVDPQKDAQAAIVQLGAGLMSPQDVIERTGRTPEEVVEELSEWKAAVDDAGLTLNPSYGGQANAGSRTAANTSTDDDETDDESDDDDAEGE